MNVRVLLLTTFGLGLMRPAPGTWSSLPWPVLAAGAAALGLGTWPLAIVQAALCLVSSVVCVVLGGFAEEHFGKKDPGSVTADEVAGQAIALLALPWRLTSEDQWFTWNAALAATAFLTFRFFDIVKVPPAAQVQRIGGGWGILLDDVVAGVYALAVTHAAAWWLLPMVL